MTCYYLWNLRLSWQWPLACDIMWPGGLVFTIFALTVDTTAAFEKLVKSTLQEQFGETCQLHGHTWREWHREGRQGYWAHQWKWGEQWKNLRPLNGQLCIITSLVAVTVRASGLLFHVTFLPFMCSCRTYRISNSLAVTEVDIHQVEIMCHPPSVCKYEDESFVFHVNQKTKWMNSWPESGSELYCSSDRRLSVKLVATFADRGCHVVSVTDLCGRILGFLDRSRYFFFQVAPQFYSWGWVNPVPDPLLVRKSDSVGNRTKIFGYVARNSDN
jgi:hypothetical protein